MCVANIKLKRIFYRSGKSRTTVRDLMTQEIISASAILFEVGDNKILVKRGNNHKRVMVGVNYASEHTLVSGSSNSFVLRIL